MSITPGDPGPTDPESGDRAIPPYDGRRETADVDGPEKEYKDGANVGGATGPVETDDSLDRPEPADTPRGAVASPSDEIPATSATEDTPSDPGVGPAHYPGTQRGEDEVKGREQPGGRD